MDNMNTDNLVEAPQTDVVVDSTTTKYIKQIKVVNEVGEVLFEGLSALNKFALKEQYGQNITVFYEKQFTTVGENQTYLQALEDTTQYSNKAYSLDEFKAWLALTETTNEYKYVTYNQRDLDNQLKSLKVISKPQKNRVSHAQPAFGVYLFTKYEEVINIPINNLTKEQLDAAKYSLKNEEDWLNDFASKNNLDINSPEVRKDQVEAVLFIAGSSDTINSYINNTRLRWITVRGDDSVKGIIKNNASKNGYQVYLLIISLQDNRNSQLLSQLNFSL